MRTKHSQNSVLVQYDRGMFRAAVVSLFWNIISYKKAREGYSLKMLSEKLGIDKSSPSRWFSGDRPNWTVNTMADIAGALDVDIEVRATDRKTGVVFASYGIIRPPLETTTLNPDPPVQLGRTPPRTRATKDPIPLVA